MPTTCFTSNAELRNAVIQYAAGTTSTSNLSNTYGYPISNWCTSKVTDFSYIFANLTEFNEPLTNWNTSRALSMKGMFAGAHAFNQPITFSTSKVTTFEMMFQSAANFAQDLTSMRTSKARNVAAMFKYAVSFNGDVSNFNTVKVTTMAFMFQGTTLFDQASLVDWDVSSCSTFEGMFKNALAFNQDLSSWDVSNADTVSSMFSGALSLSQDLCPWGDLLPPSTIVDGMFQFTTCPDNADPVLFANPPGPFCFTCHPTAPTTKEPTSAPYLPPVQSSESPTVVPCAKERDAFDFCVDPVKGNGTACEECVVSYWQTPVNGCTSIDDETCLGLRKCPKCRGCQTELIDYVSCLSECKIRCSSAHTPTHRPTQRLTRQPDSSNNNSTALATKCFLKVRRHCNCGLVQKGSKCHVVVSRTCALPSVSTDTSRRKWLQRVRSRYVKWCGAP